jgi:hypothetical protein
VSIISLTELSVALRLFMVFTGKCMTGFDLLANYHPDPELALSSYRNASSLLGKAKQWFYTDKEVVSTWEKCSNSFLTKFFSLGKTNAHQNKISSFQ